MTDPQWLFVAFLAGIGLGVLYFGGLWLTVRYLPEARSPALVALVSFAGRTLLTLLGLYLVMGGRWQRLVACLVGMVVARVALVRRLGPAHAPDAEKPTQ